MSGYPSRYRSKLYDRVTGTLAAQGYTHVQMAEAIGISRQTFDVWRKDNPTFAKAIINGKKDADEVVIQSLYKSACGYCYEDIHVTSFRGKVIQTPIIKYQHPNPTSMIFWLKNRDKANWSDKQIIAHSIADSDFIKETPAQVAAKMDSSTAPQIEGEQK